MNRAVLFLLLLLFAEPPTAVAQWQQLGTSEDVLIDQLGRPDSSDQSFDYFHHAYYGVNGILMVMADSNGDIEQANWISDALSDSIRDRVFRCIETAQDSVLTNPFNSFGETGGFRIWLVPNFVVSLYINSDSEITWRSALREPYYCDIADSEPLQDSFFSVGASAFPLDSEAIFVAKVWKKFLELPPWSVDKFMLWTRYDQLLPAYFDVPTCPDYYSQGYRAKLVCVVEDPELHAYILSTVFSPADSEDARFLPGKKTSRQITYFVREDDNWKITSALKFVTRGWKFQKAGRIRYHYSSSHVFNERKALEAGQFLDSVSAIFGVKLPPWINYYYAFQGGLYQLLGLDVQSDFNGILLDGKSTILVCDTIENYFHEFVHAALSSIPRSPIIDEGIAEFMGKDTASDSTKLAASNEFIHKEKSVTIQNIWDLNSLDTANYLIYSAGLIFFQKVAERSGMNAVVAFYKACTSEPEFEKAVKQYLNVEPKNIDQYWRAELEKSYQKLKSPSR